MLLLKTRNSKNTFGVQSKPSFFSRDSHVSDEKFFFSSSKVGGFDVDVAHAQEAMKTNRAKRAQISVDLD